MELEKLHQVVKNTITIVSNTPVKASDFQAVADALSWLTAVSNAVEKQIAEAKAKNTLVPEDNVA